MKVGGCFQARGGYLSWLERLSSKIGFEKVLRNAGSVTGEW